MKLGSMQIDPRVKRQLDSRFLTWYLAHFTSTRMCYAHWSAGRRDQNWPEYHTVVTVEGGNVVLHHNTPIDVDLPAHTYQRNTNAWAVCVGSMLGGTTANLGANAPTREQLRALVTELAHNCIALHVPVGNILTHAEAADNVDGAQGLESYGPRNGCERWDFWCNVQPQTLELAPKPGSPPGRMDFGDWLRGEVILQIAAATEVHWKH